MATKETKPETTPTAPPPQLKLLRVEKQPLRVKFTDLEVMDLGTKLAKLDKDADLAAAKAKSCKKQAEALETTALQVREEVINREGTRDVEVEIYADFRKGEAYTVRIDTGEEINRRKLTDAEREQDLPLKA